MFIIQNECAGSCNPKISFAFDVTKWFDTAMIIEYAVISEANYHTEGA